MKTILGIMAMITLSSAAASEGYLGLGGSVSNGSGWSGEAPELSLVSFLNTRNTLEFSAYSLGSRDGYDLLKIKGISAELGHAINFQSEKNSVNFGVGGYLHQTQFRSGDGGNTTINISPMFTMSYIYKFDQKLSARLKFSKYSLEKDYGSPNRLSASLMYNF